MMSIGSTRVIDRSRPMLLRRGPARLASPPRRIDEDGARRALGADLAAPHAAAAGAVIEHLARIALG